MPVLPASTLSLQLPEMYRVRQQFQAPEVTDVVSVVTREMGLPEVKQLIKPGQRIAIAVGSRGISNLSLIVHTVIQCLKELGAQPFIVPAMGSHGGASAHGQSEVLNAYGINEESMGVPVVSSMEVVQIGETKDRIPVYIDRHAYEADLIVPIARVKPHTDFKGPIESGLCKMLAIGLGKHEGCSRLHAEGFDNFPTVIPTVAEVILEHAPVGFGIAIIENAYDKTAMIRAIAGSDFLSKEPELLKIAKAMMPRIMLPDIDVLIVEQIGKDVSGAGMDPNIVGRTTKGKLSGFDGPDIQRIVVLDLTEDTHGNACGIGLADFTTNTVFQKIDYEATYANVIASANPEAGRVPVVLNDEREAVLAAIKCCSKIDIENPRIVRITDTLHLQYISVSEAFLSVVSNDDRLEIVQ